MAIPINIKSNNLDTQDNKNVGIKLPLQNSLDGSGYFEPTKLTFDAIKQNINALIKTSQGERVFHPTLGLGLKKYLFEPIGTGMDMIIKDELTNTFKKWLPFIGFRKLDVNMTNNENTDRNKLKINIEFFITNNPGMFDSVEIVIE